MSRRCPLFGRYGGSADIARTSSILLRDFQHEIDPERARRQRTRFLNQPPECVDVRAPGCQHTKPTGIAYGSRKSWTNRTTHRSLNDPQFNAETVAKSGLKLQEACDRCKIRILTPLMAVAAAS